MGLDNECDSTVVQPRSKPRAQTTKKEQIDQFRPWLDTEMQTNGNGRAAEIHVLVIDGRF